MTKLAWPVSLALFLSLGVRLDAAEGFPDHPNIIIILTDDQGYGDLSCHGNPILQTPNIDKLYSQSARFTNFHVSPTCAPSRAAFMTGRHEFHSGVTHTINERERMALSSYTLAQAMQSAGYKTAIFGKWHLGDEPAYQPGQRGFDEVFIHVAGGIGQSYAGSCGDAPGNNYFSPWILHNGTFEKTSRYCTDVFFQQATKWIDSQRGKQPFFCWIATNAPHAPLNVPPPYQQMYTGKVKPLAARFFGMIANIDDNVGALMIKLTEWDLDKTTLVIFMTDNGGTVGVPVFNAGMRGDKTTPYEGGIRVPSFWRWPGVIQPGDIDQLTAHVDLLPTLAATAGAKIPAVAAKKLEGRSLLPLLKDPHARWDDRFFVAHVGRWSKGKAAESKYAGCSIRDTRFAMVSDAKNEQKQWELFDLSNDPGQKSNIIERFPKEAKKLEAEYDRWWESVQGDLVNEDVTPPKENAYKELFVKQVGQSR